MLRGRILLDSMIDAWRCLSFERSRASTFPQALRAWSGGQVRRWRRLRRMGWQSFGRQLAVESACAKVGLLYPTEDAGSSAPWHLPERFSQMAAGQLPPHPVIEPAFVVAGLGAAASDQPALQALAALTGDTPVPALWAGLPLQGVAPPHPGPDQPPARVAVCLHLFYPELWPELHAQLRVIPEPWDLFVSVPAFAATPAWRDIQRDHPRVRFMRSPNRGRDVAPFLAWLRSGALDAYEVVCKLHGKRSPHMQGGDAWRDELFRTLLGSRENVQAILEQLRTESALGMLGPSSSHQQLVLANGWAKNRALTVRIANQLRLSVIDAQTTFFAGTMFWFKPTVFNLVRASPYGTKDFPLEAGQTDGTLAHAWERLFEPVVLASGGSIRAWRGLATTDTAA